MRRQDAVGNQMKQRKAAQKVTSFPSEDKKKIKIGAHNDIGGTGWKQKPLVGRYGFRKTECDVPSSCEMGFPPLIAIHGFYAF